MKNPTTQYVLVTLYAIGMDILKHEETVGNLYPSPRVCGIQVLINVAENVSRNGEISPELADILITEARLLK